jgi:hypothetical protein
VRYKVWRSNKDKELHLLCSEGVDAFEALPTAIRNLGPWTGSQEGEVDRLRLPYRSMLTEHGFTIVYAHISKLILEAPTGLPVLRGQAECPDCKGSGEVSVRVVRVFVFRGCLVIAASPSAGIRTFPALFPWRRTTIR